MIAASSRRLLMTHRRWISAVVAVLALTAPGHARDTGLQTQPKPPVAEKRPYAVVSPNGTRDDPYYWLRDDTRSKPDVLGYLKAENAYYEVRAAAYKDLTEVLSKEIIGRVKQDDSTVPYKYKDCVYYTRFETGKEYPIYARHPLDSEKEQILVDANREARGHEFYQVGRRAVSPDQK